MQAGNSGTVDNLLADTMPPVRKISIKNLLADNRAKCESLQKIKDEQQTKLTALRQHNEEQNMAVEQRKQNEDDR